MLWVVCIKDYDGAERALTVIAAPSLALAIRRVQARWGLSWLDGRGYGRRAEIRDIAMWPGTRYVPADRMKGGRDA